MDALEDAPNGIASMKSVGCEYSIKADVGMLVDKAAKDPDWIFVQMKVTL